ncbi:DedA family protein [Lentzea sp. NBRC 102530]|uniref:DedA family protein n=1 Tax=Lentzea sp. NBRC 102530 TaxID=3032201 RepID=UPI0024A0960C|nr:DedA family protein [Lentzea sp. NBRC 102530]GLY46661.1 membrane protein [Lentzea sp. NBRC 102530]
MPIEQWLEAIPPLLVYVIVGLVIGFESLGIPLPGEIVLVTASLLASQHDELSPLWIGVWASAGAIIGDNFGYLIGRKGGPRLFAWMGRKFPKHFGETQLDHARRVFQKRGAWAVFFGRFVALLRILAGPLAGSMHMPYGKFLAANAAGGIVWAGGTAAAVYYLGVVAEKWLKGFSYAGLAIAVVLGVAGVFIVKKRLAKAAEKAENAEKAEEVTPA